MTPTAYRLIPRCARRIAANWWTAQQLEAAGWRDLPGSHATRGAAFRAIEAHRSAHSENVDLLGVRVGGDSESAGGVLTAAGASSETSAAGFLGHAAFPAAEGSHSEVRL